MSVLDELRNSRLSPATAYSEFLDQQKRDSLHIFVEGDSDSSFYRKFFEPYFDKFSNPKFYDCGGKSEVYKTRNKIITRKDPPAWSETMVILYFVDKDLSDLLQEDYPVATDIFVTDYYSIENYLVSGEMLEIIWTDIFNFYGKDRPKFDSFLNEFQVELQRFYEYIRPVMVWGIYHKRNKTSFDFDDIELHKLFSVNEELKLTRKIGEGTQNLVNELDKMCKIETTQLGDEEKDILELIEELSPKAYVRGKFEVWFFVKFAKALAKFIKKDMQIEIRYSQGLLKEDDIVRSLGPKLSPIPKSIFEFLKCNM